MERKKELIRTVKFVLFSASAGIIQVLSLTLFEMLFTDTYWLSYLLSLILSVLWNFTLNRRFTFKSASNVPLAMLLTALFYVVFTPASTYLAYLLETVLDWHLVIVQALNMLLNFVLEYLYQRFVVFRNSIDTNDLAQKDKEK